MPYFKDLEPCTVFPGEWNNLCAVGWLARGHDFTRGPRLLSVIHEAPSAVAREGADEIGRQLSAHLALHCFRLGADGRVLRSADRDVPSGRHPALAGRTFPKRAASRSWSR